MRIPILLALLVSFLLLFIGCGDDNDNENSMFPVTTRVTTTAGTPIANANISLARNGTIIGTFPRTGNEGRSSLRVRNATGLTLVIDQTATFPRTIYGPLIVNRSRTITIPVRTFAQLQTENDVTVPTNGTATLVVFGFANADTTNTTIPVTVQVDTGTVRGPSDPVVYPNISASTTHTIKVTDPSTGRMLVFRNIAFTSDTITVLDAIFAESPNVTLRGRLTNAISGANETNANLTLFRNGQQVSTGTTNNQGQFTFTNLMTGDGFTLLATSPTNSFIRTVFVQPVTINNQNDGKFRVFTQAQLQQAFPTITTPADNNTAVVAALGFSNETDENNRNNPITLIMQVDDFTPVTGAPAVSSGTPGTYDITITDTANDRTFTLQDVTLPGGTITLIRIPNVDDGNQV